MMTRVLQTRHGPVALLEIEHPPPRLAGQTLRRALFDAVSRADTDPAIGAIVITGTARDFGLGSDNVEFGKKPQEPHLADVINRIEDAAKPVIIAWHGSVTGPGCEIGLAAHRRVMAKGSVISLPDIAFGLVPVGGGTQRLPRLIGLTAALDMIATGRHIGAAEALAIGLIDAIAETDVKTAAIALATGLAGQMQPRPSMRSPPAPDPGAWEAMVAEIRRTAKGRPAPLRAIELVGQSLSLPFTAGLASERSAFLDLMASPQSRALRHLVQAEAALDQRPDLAGISARRLEHIGILGAGAMGSGIASACLDAGLRVSLIEPDEGVMRAALERMGAHEARLERSGRLDAARRAERRARFGAFPALEALPPVDLAIEAVPEDMAQKCEGLVRLEALLKPEAVLASSTSYLDLETMADALLDPARFLGLHFFAPAPLMRLMEVARTKHSSTQTLADALGFAARLNKIAVVCGAAEGLIGNRILAKFRAQCEFMLEEGALPHEVDAALEDFGLAMGPFAAQDLAGLDLALARRKRLISSRPLAERETTLLDRLCGEGRLGARSGRGWYAYAGGKRRIDPAVEALLRAYAAISGRVQRRFSAREIEARVLAAMVNEGAHLLAAGIAEKPADIDLVMVHGFGFPAMRGGPMQEADTRGLANLVPLMRESAARDGPGFALAPLIETLLAERKPFAALNMPDGG